MKKNPKGQLKTYHSKRNFSKTPEPSSKVTRTKSNFSFVIQKHDATRLHYDFRLEIDGVLVSWAVPKGLSTKINEKRLAIRTEDHPLEYANFEGVIPKGEYGGGTVIIWDNGTYLPVTKENNLRVLKNALRNGILKFFLKGKKIKGTYALVRARNLKDKEQWLIFKVSNEELTPKDQ